MTDFRFADHGSVCILTPVSEEALKWISENIGDAAQTWGGGVVVEPRYVPAIIHGIEEDGLTVHSTSARRHLCLRRWASKVLRR